MPELPEVETMVRGIRPAVTGQRIRRIEACPCACRPIQVRPDFPAFSRRQAGRTIVEVRRLAKRILLQLDNASIVVIEPRMTGLMLLADPPDVEHLRLEWNLEGPAGRTRLWFWDRRGLGTASLFDQVEAERVLGPERLGPDALQMTVPMWRERLQKTSRPVKVALLDQKLVAGIGNLYASEILHLAKISPRRRTDRLTGPQIERLAAATREVLELAIRYEGSTLGDGTYRNALNQNGSYQNEHRVYARAGEPCPSCDSGSVRRIVQAQRATFYCPRCQR